MNNTETLNCYQIPSYFLTGKIPFGEDFAPEDRIGAAQIVSDCLMVLVLGCVFELPDQVKRTIDSAAKLLRLHEMAPPLPAYGDGFWQYALMSGIVTEQKATV